MPTWNLHIVGSKAIEDVEALAADIAQLVSSKGHTVESAVLTTDDGSSDVTPPPAEEPAPAGDTESEQPAEEVSTDTPPA